MKRRAFLAGALTAAATAALAGPALAQQAFRVGLILPMTGPFASTGRQIEAAAKLYVQRNGDTVAGRKVELILKDDGGVADATKRLAQELVVRDRVHALAGFGLTPLALATAPLATQAKVPQIVMAAATSIVTEQSPFIVRTSYTTPQVTATIADWARRNGVGRAVTLVSDYGPGIDAERAFKDRFTAAGGQVADALRVPLSGPDFAPFLQRVADVRPDALFVFVPSGVGAPFMKQFVERGLDKSGVRLLAEGGVTDDDILNGMGEPAIGVVTGYHYSAAHDSAENRAFVEAFRKASGMRPNFMAVGGYDGMHVIYEGLRRTDGAEGLALVEAVKGMSWTSPRGPVSIDPQTRDIVQNVYVREVERVGSELWNVEFATIPNVKDPVKVAKVN